MLNAPDINEFGLIIQSHNARLVSAHGATVTPGNNAYGAYSAVIAGSSVTDDVYGISILVHDISVPAAVTDSLTTIGFDPTGGTTFVDAIVDLYTCAAVVFGPTSATLGNGTEFYFPLYIPKGTSIGAKGTINNATVGTQKVSVKLWCQPSRPELVRVGQYVVTYGSVPATSTGTSVTAGTTSEGTFTQIGTVAAPIWYLTAGIGRNSATFSTEVVGMDLAIGASTTVNKVVIADQIVNLNINETLSAKYEGAYAHAATGDNLYMRLQCGSVDTAFAGIMYGVGG